MESASVTKPWAGLSSGQLRAKYPRKSESSEARRNTEGHESVSVTTVEFGVHEKTYCR